MDFQGAHGKEKAPESQQRLNRHVAQLMHGMRKKCFQDDATADAIACTDTRATEDPHGARQCSTARYSQTESVQICGCSCSYFRLTNLSGAQWLPPVQYYLCSTAEAPSVTVCKFRCTDQRRVFQGIA